MNKKIIHIGLMKTGTTTLQQHIFPKLCRDQNVLYNPAEYLKIKMQRHIYSKDDLVALKEVCSKHDVFISNEGLVEANPRNWSTGSDRVLELFGEDATIVITIREPVEYMTSLYIQKIQEGNIINPEEFFVSSQDYDALMPFLPKRSLLRFDHQRLDYENLILLYKKKFKDVYIVPLSHINTLYPFHFLFGLNPNKINSYLEALKNAPRENRSYSKLAVNLTFKREAILRTMNVKSSGSEDYPTSNNFVNGMSPLHIKRFVELPLRQKFLKFPLRAFKKVMRPLHRVQPSWRWLMQRVLDKLCPYQKFYLPKDVLETFDDRLLFSNQNIVRNAEKEIDTFLQPTSEA